MQSHDNVNWLCPVNCDHSLNRGLVAWYLALQNQPGWKSNQWLDLTDPLYGCHGTLNNMVPATAWTSTDRLGGFGALLFEGTDDFVSANIPTVSSTASWMGWVKTSSASNGMYLMDMGVNAGTISITNGKFAAIPTGGLAGGFIVDAGGELRDGTWKHLAAVQIDATFTGYVNGVQVAQITNAASSNHTTVHIGTYGDHDLNIFRFDGLINDVRIFNRALSSFEVHDLYVQSQLGHPQLLNRVGLRTFRISAGSPWYYNLQQAAA